MYAITGITGQVGGALARRLLAQEQTVRAVVRDPAKGRAWTAQGCGLALAQADDVQALTRAFADTQGVFILLPPNFDPAPGFPESRRLIGALHAALLAARPQRVVCLSTVGAQATQTSLLSQLGLLEEALSSLPMPIAFLRAAWFMENALWDVASACDQGCLDSYLQPLDRAIPMVSAADVGRTAAELLQETWTGRRIVELQGPTPVSPRDLAAGFARLLGRDVGTRAVPRERWEALFREQGMANPLPRMQMLDGFNQGWIRFEEDGVQARHGGTALDAVLRSLLERAR